MEDNQENQSLMETERKECMTEKCRNHCTQPNLLCNQCTSITKLEGRIKELSEKIEELQEYNLKLETSQDEPNKKRKLNDTAADVMGIAMTEELANKDILINNLRNENKSLKAEAASKLPRPTTKTPAKPEFATMMKELKSDMEKRFVQLEKSFQKSIEEKLGDHVKEVPAGNTTVVSSYASATASNIQNTLQSIRNNPTPFREIMMNTRNEELAEEREKKSRCCNIIIHGKCESAGEDDDKILVEELFKKLTVGALKYKSIVRLGKMEKEKNRPIKLEMCNEQDKSLVLSKLRNLKDDERFHRIGITEDYTISERLLIKGYHDKATKMNLEEPDKDNYIWRVRGSPKNGLHLKKTKKINQVPVKVMETAETTA